MQGQTQGVVGLQIGGFSKKDWVANNFNGSQKTRWKIVEMGQYVKACLEVRERIGAEMIWPWSRLREKAVGISEKLPACSRNAKEILDEMTGKTRYTLGSESAGKIERLAGKILAESKKNGGKRSEPYGLMTLAAEIRYLVRMCEFADDGNLAGLVHYVEHELPKSTKAAEWLAWKDRFGSTSELHEALKTAREWAGTEIGLAQREAKTIDIPKAVLAPPGKGKETENAWNLAKDADDQAGRHYARLLGNCAGMVMWAMGECALKLHNSARYSLQTVQGTGRETCMKTLYLLGPASAMRKLIDAARWAAGKPITEENAGVLFGGKAVEPSALLEIAEGLYRNSEGDLTRKIRHLAAMLVFLHNGECQKLAEYWEHEVPRKAKEGETRLGLIIAEIKKTGLAA